MDSGEIILDGIDISRLPEHKRAKYIGRVFQDPLKGTAYDMTIEENLSIAYNKIRSRGLQVGINRRDREIFREKLSLLGMGLEDRMKEKARLLSGGQRQALTLFMAVIAKPKLLLLDEHTAALDPSAAKKVLELTDRFAGEEPHVHDDDNAQHEGGSGTRQQDDTDAERQDNDGYKRCGA